MSPIIINPGTGPVSDASLRQAETNMPELLLDAGIEGATIERRPDQDDGEGRFSFLVALDDRQAEVDMPGLPLGRVRYQGTEDQNIFDFPRLYVDGSSWVWPYAVSQVAEALNRLSTF